MSNGQDNLTEIQNRPLHLKAVRMKDYWDKFWAGMPSFFILAIVALLVWVLSGIYTIGPEEVGQVKRWGRKVRPADPGLHYHLPYPIETVVKIETDQIRRMEIGFRSNGSSGDDNSDPGLESLMLTRDGNLVEVGFIVQYRIEKVEDYLYKITSPDQALRSAAESAMRSVISGKTLDEALTHGQNSIQEDTAKKLQQILDKYNSGLKLVALKIQALKPPQPVKSSFESVDTAREEKEKIVAEARGSVEQLLADSQGQAAALKIKAEAYQDEKINRAQGESERFLRLLAEYKNASDVTRQRLYLEAMEEVLLRAGKIILNPEKGDLLPLYNLPVQRQPASAPRPD